MGHYTRRHRATLASVALLGGVWVLASACSSPSERHDSDETLGRVSQAFTGTTAEVNTEYGQWKALYVKDVAHCGGITPCKRVARLDEGNDTVSEGIGYGMLLSAFLDDRPTFDGLWNYYRTHVNANGVMHWKWDANNNKTGDNEATDAIEDACIGLIVADKRGWGTPAGDTLTYNARATSMIGKILQFFVTATDRPKPGDAVWEVWERCSNPSYLIAPYATVFATYTGVTRWNSVKDKEYQLLGLIDGFYPGAASTGLVPDWIYDNGTPNWNGKYICDASEINWDKTGTGGCRAEWFSYDAIRTPWRLAMDWTWNADSRAGTRLNKMNAWAIPKNGDIINGYKLDGSEGTAAEYPGGTKVVQAAFVGPMAAASVKDSAAYQTTMWNKLMSLQEGSNYFSDTLRILTLTFLSGNMPNPLTIGGGCSCPDDGNACTDDVCNGGSCTHPPKANGTACNDSNACTQTDSCQSGSCTGSNPVVCTASDQCHDVGTCNTATGVCSNPNKPNGTACNDNNASTCNDVCTSGSCGGGACGSLDPVAAYNFNETSGTTAADSSGNGLNATLSGATFVPGFAGNAVRIAGGTQRVNLPANIVQSCSDTTGFTIAARVNLATNTGNWARIFDIGSSTTNYMFLTPRTGTTNALRFAMKVNNGTEQQINYAFSMPLSAWKHIAVTLSGNTGTMYVDGAQVAQNTAFTVDPSGMAATANNWLGDSQFSGDATLDGSIDDLKIACRAYSASEISALAGSGCTLPAAPGAPGATGGTEQVSLSWPAVTGATSYTVRRSSSSGGPYTDIATGVTSTSYVNTASAGTYYYVIAAVNSCGTGPNSAQVSAVSTNAAPSTSITSPIGGATFAAPANITINANASDTSFGSISKVEFYQGTTLLGTDTTSPYGFSWTNVPAATYSLTTKAYDNLNAITTSSAVSITVNGGCTLPAAPASPAATGGTEQVSVSWAAVTGATSYTLRRSSTSGGPYTDVATGVTTTSKVDAVTAGTYYYVVAAVNSCGTGPISAQVSGVSTNAAPSVSITAPSGGATFTAPASIAISANAADTSFGSISKVEFYQGTTLLGTDTTSPYGFSWTNVPAASYSLTAKAYDNLNAVTTSTGVSITVSGGGGTAPCDGLCTNPTLFTTQAFSSGNLGPNATCHQYTGTLGGANFGNFVAPRTISVNGVNMGSAGGNISLPAPRNGGYCFQATAGSYDWAYFGTW